MVLASEEFCKSKTFSLISIRAAAQEMEAGEKGRAKEAETFLCIER